MSDTVCKVLTMDGTVICTAKNDVHFRDKNGTALFLRNDNKLKSLQKGEVYTILPDGRVVNENGKQVFYYQKEDSSAGAGGSDSTYSIKFKPTSKVKKTEDSSSTYRIKYKSASKTSSTYSMKFKSATKEKKQEPDSTYSIKYKHGMGEKTKIDPVQEKDPHQTQKRQVSQTSHQYTKQSNTLHNDFDFSVLERIPVVSKLVSGVKSIVRDVKLPENGAPRRKASVLGIIAYIVVCIFVVLYVIPPRSQHWGILIAIAIPFIYSKYLEKRYIQYQVDHTNWKGIATRLRTVRYCMGHLMYLPLQSEGEKTTAEVFNDLGLCWILVNSRLNYYVPLDVDKAFSRRHGPKLVNNRQERQDYVSLQYPYPYPAGSDYYRYLTELDKTQCFDIRLFEDSSNAQIEFDLGIDPAIPLSDVKKCLIAIDPGLSEVIGKIPNKRKDIPYLLLP